MKICENCGSNEIEQMAEIWLPMNDSDSQPTDFQWTDKFWCVKCDFECAPKEIQEECEGK